MFKNNIRESIRNYNEKQKLLLELKAICNDINIKEYKNKYSIFQLEAMKAFILAGIDLNLAEKLVKDRYIVSNYNEIIEIIFRGLVEEEEEEVIKWKNKMKLNLLD